MNLVDTIKAIQRVAGAVPDGVFGPESATAVLREFSRAGLAHPGAIPTEGMDSRSAMHLASLDAQARGRFMEFYRLAAATAATYGCTYVMISGHRTWEEQDALYAKGRTAPGGIVTNARGGQSNHNFGIAADFGVFQGKVYLDGGSLRQQQDLASKVHKACSLHADVCGLEWGGSWRAMKDEPHYEVATGLPMAAKRALYLKSGSVL